MAKYVDGFVIPVPKKKLKAYQAMAKKAGAQGTPSAQPKLESTPPEGRPVEGQVVQPALKAVGTSLTAIALAWGVLTHAPRQAEAQPLVEVPAASQPAPGLPSSALSVSPTALPPAPAASSGRGTPLPASFRRSFR